MADFISRLAKFMQEKGINDNQITIAAGLSNGLIGKAKVSGKGMTAANIEKILRAYPQLSPEWLLTGNGEMLKDRRDKVNAMQSDNTGNGIPLIPIDAMAGFFTGEVTDYDKNCKRLNIPGIKADFVVPVSGDSMEPKYFSGDLVACQMVNLSDLFFQWGKVYVIDTDQGVLIKKVKRSKNAGHITLVSENPDYDDIEVQYSHIYHISLVKAIVRFT